MTSSCHQTDPEGRITRCPIMRWTYVALGFLFIGLAVVGAVLPVMPTTIFVLIAAACFARGSERFEGWLLNSAWFGPMVRSWRASRSIPVRAKRVALAMIAVTFAISVAVVPFLVLKILLPAIGVCVAWYIWRLPTAEAAAAVIEEPARSAPELSRDSAPSRA